MKNKTLLIFFISCLSLTLLSQSKKIYIIDEINKTPISFGIFISGDRYFITNEKGFAFVEDSLNSLWHVRHLSYNNVVFQFNTLKSKDTIFMKPKLNELNEIVIASEKSKTDYYKIINKIIKKYRSIKSKYDFKYLFYLESSLSNKIVEKLLARLNVKYSNQDGFELGSNYVDFGKFWYNKNAPFLNLQTEKLLLKFDIFSQKNKTDPYFIFTNSEISRSNYIITTEPCTEYHENIKKIQLISKNNDEKATIFFDPENLNIIELNLNLINPEKLIFYQISNNDSISIKNISLNYIFDEKQEISNIQYKINLAFNGLMLEIKGFFKKVDLPIESKYQHTITGSYDFDNIYEQILLFQDSDDDLINEVFDKKYYEGFNISDTVGLTTLDIDFKFFLLENSLGKFHYKLWKEDRLKTSQIRYSINEKDYRISRFGEIIPYRSDIQAFWVFDFDKRNDSIEIKTMPSVLNADKSTIFHNCLDTAIINLKLNLAFDLFEIARIDLIDSLKKMNLREMSNSELSETIKLYYNKQYKDINDVVNFTFYKGYNISLLISLDSLILNMLSIDNIQIFFESEIPIIIKDPHYTSILDIVEKKGFRHNKQNRENIYFTKAIKLINCALNYCETYGCKEIQIGSFYSRLTSIYLAQGNFTEACNCLKKVKEYWPNAFEYLKSNNRIGNCDF